jgi:hypothetical protein
MSGSNFVARTAEGLTHLNTLVLRKLWTVVIHIDLPSQPAETQDKPAETTSPDSANTSDTTSETNSPDSTNTSDNTQDPTPNTQDPAPNTQDPNADTQHPTPDTQPFEDSYQLLSDIGLYDKTLPRSEATKEDETHLTLRFTQVVPEGTYSLYHRLPSGVEFPVFLEVPFTVLEDHGSETEEPAAEEWELPTFEPDPEMASGDEHLLHHEADHAVLEGPDEWWLVPLTGESAPAQDSGTDTASDDQPNNSEAPAQDGEEAPE